MPEYTEEVWPAKWGIPILGVVVALAGAAAAYVMIGVVDWEPEAGWIAGGLMLFAGLVLLAICLTEAAPCRISIHDGTLYVKRWSFEITKPIAWIDAIEDVGIDDYLGGRPAVRLWSGGEEIDRLVPTLHAEALAQAIGKPLITYSAAEAQTVEQGEPYEEVMRGSTVRYWVWAGAMVACYVPLAIFLQSGRRPLFAACWLVFAASSIPANLIPRLRNARLTVKVANGVLSILHGRDARQEIRIGKIEWVVLDSIPPTSAPALSHSGPLRYHVDYGPAVRIGVRGLSRRIIVRTNDPESLAKALGKELLPEPPVPVL